MEPAISRVVIDRSVAARPAVEGIEEEEIVDRAETVVLDPGLASVSRVKKSITCGPTVERINKSDRVYLPIDRNDCPRSPRVRRMRKLAHIIKKRGRSDPAFGWRKRGDSLQAEPGRNRRLLRPTAPCCLVGRALRGLPGDDQCRQNPDAACGSITYFHHFLLFRESGTREITEGGAPG